MYESCMVESDDIHKTDINIQEYMKDRIQLHWIS